MYRQLLYIIFFVISISLYSQNEDNNWFFGGEYGLPPTNQNPNCPIVGLNFNTINAGLPSLNNTSPYLYSENHTAISDQNGELLFYTNGVSVWDKNHNQMPNGDNLGGNISSVKSSLIVPVPGSINKYYIFAIDGFSTGTGAGLFYSIVDMNLNNCLGDIEPIGKKTLLLANTSEWLIGTYHGNGTDYWVLTTTYNPVSKLYLYHVSSAGISAPIITDLSVAPYNISSIFYNLFQMSFNNSGKKLAAFFSGMGGGAILSSKFILDFNINTGAFTFDQNYDNNQATQFMVFSQNDQFLYEAFSHQTGPTWITEVFQYDMNMENISNSKTTVGILTTGQGGARLGPDGKIYMSNKFVDTQFLNVIRNPDIAGVACNIVANDLDLGGRKASYLPNVFLKPYYNSQQIKFTYQDTCLGANTMFTYTSDLPYDSLVWQFGDGQTITTTNQSVQHIYSNANNYNVVLTLFDGCYVKVETFKPINIVNGTSVNLGSDISICDGQSIILDAGTIGANYLWNDDSNNQTLVINQNGTYSVTVTNDNGCNSIDSINITSTILNTNFNITNVSCNGNSDGAIDLTINSGQPPYSFIWSNSEITEDINALTFGIYTITITDVNNCQFIKNTEIQQPNELNIEFLDDMYICSNSFTTIKPNVTGGTEPYIYQWNTGNTNDSIIISTNDQITYYLTVNDVNNCIESDSITVNVYSPLELSLSSNNDTVCLGESALLNANISGGLPPYSLYNNNQIITIPNTVYPTNNQTYIYTVKDQCDNTKQNSITIYNYPNPVVSFTSDITKGCVPLDVHFNNAITCNNCEYFWQFDNNNISLSNNPQYIFKQNGIYNITLSLTNEYGCKNSKTIENMIEVYSKPLAKFEPEPEITNIIKPNIYFNNYSEGATNYYWDFNDGNKSSLKNPIHKYNSIGKFNTKLIVSNEYNCIDSAQCVVIIQDDVTLYVPTAFTPDGDGINDGFKAIGYGISPNNYHIYIYNRWGEQIWHSNNISEEWKANYKIENGVYTWFIIWEDINKIKHEKTGKVSVIR